MRHVICLLVFFSLSLFTIDANAQVPGSPNMFKSPVKWSFTTEKINDSEVWLIFTAKIESTWHMYSLESPKDGPVPTSFAFTPSVSYKPVGKTIEVSPVTREHEKAFDMELSYFKNKAVFKQKIKISSAEPFTLKGTLEYMVCNGEMCMPPTTEDFEFKLQGAKSTVKLVPVK